MPFKSVYLKKFDIYNILFYIKYMPIKNGSKKGQVSRSIKQSYGSHEYKSQTNGLTKKQKREKSRELNEQELAKLYCNMARKRR